MLKSFYLDAEESCHFLIATYLATHLKYKGHKIITHLHGDHINGLLVLFVIVDVPIRL